MYYSAIGMIAIVLHLIMNHEFIKADKNRDEISRAYRRFVFASLLYYITDALWEKSIIYKKFESIELPIVESYDELLKNLYGDYMKLPCEKERVPAHDGFYRKDVN